MQSTKSLTNQFLIAMPGLEDPNFSRTVTYICEHNEQGAMGIIVNRPINIRLGEMLDQLEISSIHTDTRNIPIYLGGPVQTDRGFVIHSGHQTWDSTLQIAPEINITTSRDILEAIAQGRGPTYVLIALGYAGWLSGQIEEEIGTNTWLSSPASANVLFSIPTEQRWQAAAQGLGIDMGFLSVTAGHA
ncbi:hypothetical protein TI05_09400 [Achromatium sp. WMS3]|nr:hypothetical protein TI05_09400 [Achromatium sp. WMS3]